jgi:hypothetical protein
MPPLNPSTLAGPSDIFSAIPGTAPPVAAAATPAPVGPPPMLSRPLLASRWSDRSRRARQRTRFKTRVEAMVQDLHGVRVLTRHDIDDGNLQEALDAAIDQARLAMTPLSEAELRNPGNRNFSFLPIAHDIVLASAGKVLAIVFATADGPRVHRFYPTVPTRR